MYRNVAADFCESSSHSLNRLGTELAHVLAVKNSKTAAPFEKFPPILEI